LSYISLECGYMQSESLMHWRQNQQQKVLSLRDCLWKQLFNRKTIVHFLIKAPNLLYMLT